MKKSVKIFLFAGILVLCIAFLAVFFSIISSKPGDTVYIVGLTGDVVVGTTNNLNRAEPAYVGMSLTSENIIATGDKSSCMLAYSKDAESADNYITVNKNSQVCLRSMYQQGGYDFFIADGSVICSMVNTSRYETTISTDNYGFIAEHTIAKLDYDADSKSSKIFVFDGNPNIQVIQPSGAVGRTEKLLKNSVCAVQNMSDGTVGFGCLNTGFGLNGFSAQDLRTMSGIANTWSDRLSYSMSEFEHAFQTASDMSDYTTVTAATLATVPQPVAIEIASSEAVTADTFNETVESEISVESITSKNTTSSAVSTILSENEPETSDGGEPENGQNVVATSASTSNSQYVVKPNTSTSSGPYVVTPVEVTTTPASELVSSSEEHTASSVVTTIATKSPSITTVVATSATKPVTTVPVVQVDPNATYTVIFTYSENGNDYWAMQLVKYGQSAIAPDVPDVEGKYFVKWDQDFSYVTSDMTINGIFADGEKPKTQHTVKLYVENELWKTVTVKHGCSVKLNDVPQVDGKVFAGWSEDIKNVKSDITAFALFSS